MARLESTLGLTAKRVEAHRVVGEKLEMEVGVLSLEVGAKRGRSAGAREEAEVSVGVCVCEASRCVCVRMLLMFCRLRLYSLQEAVP